MKRIHPVMPLVAAAAFVATSALAKLPAPDAAAQAKAAETKAKADWQAKVDGYQLCKVQDRIAGRFKNRPASVKSAAAAPTVPTASAAPAAAGGPPPAAAAPGTPVAVAPPPPCVDPGAFAYAPPEQKPLESAGAHSPAATAASPPSVRPHSGEFPAKK